MDGESVGYFLSVEIKNKTHSAFFMAFFYELCRPI